MKTITLFYLADCPYCHYARRAVEELVKEDPVYGEVKIDWIEESARPEIANQYDYYYVPTIFEGKKKLYEAHPSETYDDCKKHVRAALDAVLEKAQ